jgi:GWxTD domain-containing protein
MNYLETWIQAPFAKALGWSLIHFLWEGVLIALLLAALLFLCRRGSARVRYALACLALLAMPVAVGITLALTAPGHPTALLLPRMDVTDAGPLSMGPLPPRAGPMSLQRCLPWVAPFWMAGVLIFYLRSLGSWMVAQRLRRAGVCAAPSGWQARLYGLCGRLGLSRPVILLESCLVDVPLVMGFLRPVILMPMGLLAGLTTDQLESILIHELAHIRRWDYVVNLLQNLVEGLLFYHPAVWWVSGQVRAERENCCDDVVVKLKGDARGYAAALATLEKNRWPAQEPALAATGGSLMKRIRRLLQEPEGHRASAAPVFVVGLLVVSLGVAVAEWQTKPSPAPQPVRSQAPSAETHEPYALPGGAIFTNTGKIIEFKNEAEFAGALDYAMAQAERVAVSPQPEKPPATLVAQAAPVQDRSSRFREEAERQLAEQQRLLKGLETPYQKWVKEDVAYIITDQERAAFKNLQADEEREKFIEQFWLRRNPTPGTAENPMREEHYRRIAYANDHFAYQNLAGWKTDRGRVYITYGPPDEIVLSLPSGGAYQRPAEQGGGTTSWFPFQRWRYRYIEGVGTDVTVEFVDPARTGEYRMTKDPNEKERSDYIEGYVAGVTRGAAEMGVAQVKTGATVQVMGTPTATGGRAVLVSIPLNAYGNHAVNVLGTITSGTGRPVSTFSQSIPGPAPLYTRFIPLSPGSYRLTIVLQDVTTGTLAHDEMVFEAK